MILSSAGVEGDTTFSEPLPFDAGVGSVFGSAETFFGRPTLA